MLQLKLNSIGRENRDVYKNESVLKMCRTKFAVVKRKMSPCSIYTAKKRLSYFLTVFLSCFPVQKCLKILESRLNDLRK